MWSFLPLSCRPSPMPKSKAKAGVSRHVKFSQPGPQGQPQTMMLNQPALIRRREAATKTRLDFLQGTLSLGYSHSKYILNLRLFYLGLGDEGKQVLAEFGGTPQTESINIADSGPTVGDEQSWETLEQEGIALGFIDDIQGLLDGK